MSSSHTFPKYLSMVSTRQWMNSRTASSFYTIQRRRARSSIHCVSFCRLAARFRFFLLPCSAGGFTPSRTHLVLVHADHEEEGGIPAVHHLVLQVFHEGALFVSRGQPLLQHHVSRPSIVSSSASHLLVGSSDALSDDLSFECAFLFGGESVLAVFGQPRLSLFVHHQQEVHRHGRTSTPHDVDGDVSDSSLPFPSHLSPKVSIPCARVSRSRRKASMGREERRFAALGRIDTFGPEYRDLRRDRDRRGPRCR